METNLDNRRLLKSLTGTDNVYFKIVDQNIMCFKAFKIQPSVVAMSVACRSRDGRMIECRFRELEVRRSRGQGQPGQHHESLSKTKMTPTTP